MNLFDNILNQSKSSFLGTQPPPTVPSFMTQPQAPRTSSYSPPVQTQWTPKNTTGFAPGYEGTVDQTQSPLFQALQGAQNVYNELPKALKATAESGKDQFEQDIKKKQVDFANAMLSKGYAKADIFKKLDELKAKGEFDYKPGIAERIVGGVGERLGKIGETTNRISQIEDPVSRTISGVVPYAGQTVASAFQPISSTIEPYISPVVKAVIEKTGQTENVQELAKGWSEFEKTNPILAENIAGLLNVGQLAPIPFAKPIGNAIKTGTVATGKAIVRGAEKIVPNLAKQSKKLISQADMGYRAIAEDIAVPKLSEMGMREKQKVVGNVIETKPGLFKKEELVRSPQESLAIEEVSRMLKEGKLKKGGTDLQKSSAISDEISGLAESLKGRLDNTPNPVEIPKSDINTLLDDITKNIDRNPFLKAGELDKSAKQIVSNIREQLTKESYTPSELLDIRKQLDSDIKMYKGDKAFSPDIENAFSTTLRDIRQGINNKISDLVPDADVKNLLDRQSALYIARDNVDLKWSKQSNSVIGRALTKVQSATGIPRTEIIEALTAGGLLLGSSLAPVMTPIVVGATAIAGGKKIAGAILSPKNKMKIANIISKIDEAIKKNPKDADLIKAKELFTNPTNNVGNPTNIGNTSNNRSSNPQSIVRPSQKKIVKPKP